MKKLAESALEQSFGLEPGQQPCAQKGPGEFFGRSVVAQGEPRQGRVNLLNRQQPALFEQGHERIGNEWSFHVSIGLRTENKSH